MSGSSILLTGAHVGPTKRRADERLWRKAVISQANRKQMRWTVYSDLNRLPTTSRLWCAYVAPRISVNCYRPIDTAGRRVGCAGSQSAGATLAWLRLPAGLSSATE